METLAASAIIGVASLSLGVSLNKLGQSNTKAKAAFSALAMESALQLTIQNPSSFSSVASDLSQRRSTFPSLTLALKVPSGSEESTISIPLGQDVYFNSQGQVCTSCAQDQSWSFLLRVQGREVATSPYPIYALAYSISFNSRIFIHPNLGSKKSTEFALEDYKWIVPPEVYSGQQTARTCDSSNGEVFVTGVNKNTGDIFCLPLDSAAENACASNQIAVGWKISNGKLQLSCQDLGTGACPAANFALQSFNAQSLAGSAAGSCVYITSPAPNLQTSSTGIAPPYTGRKIQSSQICPPNYKFVGDCVIAWSQQWPGFDEGCSAPSTGSRPVPVYPSSYRQLIKSLPSTGSAVSCELLNPVETHALGNAVWDAQIQLAGNCVLDLPSENINLVDE